MQSGRQRVKFLTSKRKLLTTGGRRDYHWDPEEFDALARIFLNINKLDQCKRLLKDLFTDRELSDIIRRLWIAKYLSQKKSYSEIAMLTKSSSNTISYIRDVLENGEGGLTEVLNKFKIEIKSNREDPLKKSNYIKWRLSKGK